MWYRNRYALYRGIGSGRYRECRSSRQSWRHHLDRNSSGERLRITGSQDTYAVIARHNGARDRDRERCISGRRVRVERRDNALDKAGCALNSTGNLLPSARRWIASERRLPFCSMKSQQFPKFDFPTTRSMISFVQSSSMLFRMACRTSFRYRP